MGSLKHKDKEFPVRYSLTPEDSRKLASQLGQRKKLTYSSVNTIATNYGVAAKTIHSFCERLKINVVQDAEPIPPKTKPCSKTIALVQAEAAFKKPEPEATPKKPERPLLEDDALASLIEMEEKMEAEQAEAMAVIVQLETETNALRAQAEKATQEAAAERERAEQAIQQTRQLRIATRGARDDMRNLESELYDLQRNHNRVCGVNRSLHLKVRESMEREQALLDALALSEGDLARCKASKS